jgi:hypothetical protein
LPIKISDSEIHLYDCASLSPAFEQTLTADALRDKIDDAESALRPSR